MSPYSPYFYQLSAVFAFGALAELRSWIDDNKGRQEAGRIGEAKVDHLLQSMDEVEHVSDVVIGKGRKTVQIDHVVKTHDRIYVVETKNWKGQIAGDASSKDWVLHRSNGKESKHYNPILQVARHVDVLSKICNFPVEGIVVMTNSVEHISGKLPWGVVRLKRLKGLLNGKVKVAPQESSANQKSLDSAWSKILQISEDEAHEQILKKHLDYIFQHHVNKPWRIWITASLVSSALAMLLNLE